MNLMADRLPDVGQKFVAFFNDGSGCRMYMRADDFQNDPVFLCPEGEQYGIENMGDYLFWQPVPEEYAFWFEGR